jgi:flagellar biosynthesis protein FlhB
VSEFPASERRRREARAHGQVAVSGIACGAGALVGAVLAGHAGGATARLVAFARSAFAATPGDEQLRASAVALVSTVAAVIAPVLAGALLGALFVGLVQTGALFAPRAIGRRDGHLREERPVLSRWLLAIGLAAVGLTTMRDAMPLFARADGLVSATLVLRDAFLALVPRALILFALAGLGDWAWRRVRLERSLRMTRAEREAERRQDEADPRVAQELRRRHRS